MDSKSGIITSVMTIVAPTKIERYSNQNLENSRKYLKIKPSGRLAFFFFLAFFSHHTPKLPHTFSKQKNNFHYIISNL